MRSVRFEVFWRVALVQLVAVAALSLLLAAVLSHGFFVAWRWFAGPASWLLCAWLTARVVGLDVRLTLLRAAIAGLVSLLAVLIGSHWLGALVAVGLFAYFCALGGRAGSLRPG
jgi:hypothetical protein